MNEQVRNEQTEMIEQPKRRGRKILKKILITVIVIVLITAILDFVSFMFVPSVSYTFTPTNCDLLFGITPQEFQTTYLDLYNETGDLRKTALVNSKGVTLCLTRRQERALRNSEWLTGFKEYEDGTMFSISDDFKEVTAYFPEEQTEEEYDEMLTHFKIIMRKIVLIQVIDDLPVEECTITYIEMNASTGEIVHIREFNSRD